MKIQEAYLYFLNIVEKNSTNNNLDIDKSRFVEWFNFSSAKYQEDVLTNKTGNSEIREMSPFLVSKSLSLRSGNKTYDIYDFPKDFFDISSVYLTANKGKCVASDFELDEVKDQDIPFRLNDSNYTPSFKARETFYTLMDGGLAVYHKEDFEIKEVLLSYYRQIPEVDMSGYIRYDGSNSTDIDPETSKRTTINILELMATLFITAQGDLNKYQASVMNYKNL